MTIFVIIAVFFICSIGVTLAQGPPYIVLNIYDNCGSDSVNYSLVERGILSDNCSSFSNVVTHLVQTNSNGQSYVNSFQVLAAAVFPSGVYMDIEVLWLVTAGPLQSQYVYQRVINLQPSYMKKCSSVLGYSYITSKNATLMISKKLDLNIFLSSGGAFEAFRNNSPTVCKGKFHIY